MERRLKKLKWNVILSIAYEALLVASGLILPRIFLSTYGSEVNGLISSLTKFLSVVNICEMGIGAVVTSAFYKPLADGNQAQISKVFVFARKYFRSISWILLVYVVVLAFVYPYIVESSFDYWFSFGLVLVMSISQFAQYFIGSACQILLNADQKNYVQFMVNGATLLLNTILSIVLILNGAGVHTVKLTTALIYLCRPLFLYGYVRKHYALDYKAPYNKNAVPQKWSGVIQHISYMIYGNTDVLVLTLCSTLANVSVYAIYSMVISSLQQFVVAAMNGIQSFFGDMIAKKEKDSLQYSSMFFNWSIHTIATLLFTVAAVLILPFVMCYTAGINDADYYTPTFAYLLVAAFFVNTLRTSMYAFIKAAGHYRQTRDAVIVEASTNVVLSLALVKPLGLVGVALGTLVAAMFFAVYEAIYLSRNIIFWSLREIAKQMLLDVAAAAVMILTTLWIPERVTTFGSWLGYALLTMAICTAEMVLLQVCFSRKNVKILMRLHK